MPPGATREKSKDSSTTIDSFPTLSRKSGYTTERDSNRHSERKDSVKTLKFALHLFFPKKAKVRKKKKRKFRPSPPGQKLIFGIVVSCLLLLAQSLFRHPGGIPVDLTLGQDREVLIEPPFRLSTSLEQLSQQLSSLSKPKSVTPGVFAINLSTGKYVDFNGQQAFSAASMIKVPILVSFLMAVERGECSMSDELVIREDLITNGSGFLQWKPIGTKISARKAAQLMMMVSDNTATNLLIDLLGGADHVNKDFHRWGLKQTKVNHLLADLEGTNTTCPYDMVYLLGRVDHGELINDENRAFMYEIMAKCKNRSLLPQGLDGGAAIIHKTGTIGGMVGDAGIVTTSGGIRYAVAIQCSRNRNDSHANNLIREMSKLIYGTYSKQLPPMTAKRDSATGKTTVLKAMPQPSSEAAAGLAEAHSRGQKRIKSGK